MALELAHRAVRISRRVVHRTRDDAGFTLIEILAATAIFLVVSAGVAGVLTSSIASHSYSKERTRAEEVAQAQIERIRTLTYANVGTVAGNPPGTIPPAGWNVPAGYTVGIDVNEVTDPGASSYNPSANFRKATVTVTRSRDGKRLAQMATLVAPTTRTSLGGISGAALTVKVKDLATDTGVPDADVALTGGPSPDRSDTTDASGEVAFLALLATNPAPPKDHYDVAVTKTGYQTYAADVSPATPAHLTLAPTETATTTIRIFKPASIIVALKDSSGNPYALPATVKILSAKTSVTTTFPVNDPSGVLTVNGLGSDPVYPNVLYTVRAFTSTGLCAGPLQQSVPDAYPTTLTTTFTLTLTTCPSGTITTNVQQLGVNVDLADVTLTDGPNDVNVSGQTDAGGNVTFSNVPSGTDVYTLTASKTVGGASYSGTTTTTVSTGATSNVSITLANPPTSTVNVTVTQGGSPLAGATVTLGNSPFGLTYAPVTTNGSGVATFAAVPVGTGYSVTATKSGVTASNGSVTVAGATTFVALAMPSGSVTVNATQYGAAAGGATVQLSGGPFSITQTATANGSGAATFTGIVAGSGYSVQASRYGQSATVSSLTVTNGSTTTVPVAIPDPPAGSVTVNVTWATTPVSGATVLLTNTGLGYSQSQTTSASGSVTFTDVPAGSGYTATATHTSGQSATDSAVTVTAGSTTTVPLALPTQTLTVNVKRSGSNQVGATVRLSGGPMSIAPVTAATNGSGNAVYSNVPVGTGYTIKANANPCSSVSNPKGVTVTGRTVNATPTTINVSYSSNTCPQP